MADLKELGRAGLSRWGGHVNEEFLPELSGIKGVRVYQEMSDNDSTVGAILFAIKMLIRQASWSVQAAGTDKKDVEAAEFVESCLHDMTETWTNTVAEILSFLTYGWSVHEICYKRRMGRKKDPRLDSKFDDGLIGWLKLPIRAQESLYEWEFDSSDNLTAFIQMPAPFMVSVSPSSVQVKFSPQVPCSISIASENILTQPQKNDSREISRDCQKF